jgi:hypothetical protein
MAHPDLDTVLNALLPFAQQMLAKHGEFHPFGASMRVSGEVSLAAGMPETNKPESTAVIEMLTSAFKQQAKDGLIRATGVCFDSRVLPPGASEKVEAICCRLEHMNGESAEVFLPDKTGWFGRVKYGSLLASKGDSQIFGAR